MIPKKTFIVDTNVILHDPSAISTLSQNNTNKIILPIIVLEELDKFKLGTNIINFNARDFIRKLEKETIKVTIDIQDHKFPPDLPLSTDSKDNKILACAYYYNKTIQDSIFVSKDVNLRMKARAIGLVAQDYKMDKMEYTPYVGYSIMSVPSNIISDLNNNGEITPDSTFTSLVANQYFLLKDSTDEKNRVLAKYNKVKNLIIKIISESVLGVNPKNLEQTFAIDALLDPNIPLVALSGISGSGKTLISLATAIENKKNYQQIFITRQVIPVGHDIGFLPGSVEDKLKPYLEPFYDNLKFLKTINKTNKEKIEKMLTDNKIDIAPITYSRGRSMPKACLLVDECQNTTPHEIKTIITRAGEGTKVVLLGDTSQVDTPYLDKNSNGLTYAINKFKDQNLFAHIHLSKGERSELAELASKIL